MESDVSRPARLALQRNLAGGVFAVFAACAGIVQAANGPAWLKVFSAAIALIGALVALALLLRERNAHREVSDAERALSERVRSAVELSLSRADDGSRLWVSNVGLHVVHDIEINAIPDDEEWMPHTHGALPRLYEETGPGVQLTAPILGGWFYARVHGLSPGRGVCVVRYHEDADDYQRIDFDVNWNDHEGLQRKGHVSLHVRECDGSLELTPRAVV